jgi:hypothetical protein
MSIGKFIPVLLFSIMCPVDDVHAQLRPLDPIDVHAFDDPIHVDVGVGVYSQQRASLAGTQGTLWELGNVRVTIRSGRVIMEMAGTVQRLFSDVVVFASPFGDAAAPSPSGHRHDAGDYRVASIFRLTPAHAATLATLRFGTRLPTTDNRVGLDRDATDFFATLGAHRWFGNLALSAEAGVGINGTRKTTYEQSDVLVYSLGGELRLHALSPYIVALGQEDLHNWIAIRGNEDLGELRIGVRAGRKRWLNAAWVHGYHDYSPRDGLQIGGGFALQTH